MTEKQVLNDFQVNEHVLLSQSPRESLNALGRMFDLFDQDHNRFGWRRLPPLCIQCQAALPLLVIKGWV